MPDRLDDISDDANGGRSELGDPIDSISDDVVDKQGLVHVAEPEKIVTLTDEEYADMHPVSAYVKGMGDNFGSSIKQVGKDAVSMFSKEGVATVLSMIIELAFPDMARSSGSAPLHTMGVQLQDDYAGVIPGMSRNAKIRTNKKLHTDPVGSTSDLAAVAVPVGGTVGKVALAGKMGSRTARVAGAMNKIAQTKTAKISAGAIGAVADPAGALPQLAIDTIAGGLNKIGDIKNKDAIKTETDAIKEGQDAVTAPQSEMSKRVENERIRSGDIVADRLKPNAEASLDNSLLDFEQSATITFTDRFDTAQVARDLINPNKIKIDDLKTWENFVDIDSMEGLIVQGEVLTEIFEPLSSAEKWSPEGLSNRISEIGADRLKLVLGDETFDNISKIAETSKGYKSRKQWIKASLEKLGKGGQANPASILGGVGALSGIGPGSITWTALVAGLVGPFGARHIANAISQKSGFTLRPPRGFSKWYDSSDVVKSMKPASRKAGQASRKVGETERRKRQSRGQSQASLPPGRILDLITNVH